MTEGIRLNGCFIMYSGPVSSFLVVSDPEAAKHVLRATDNPKRPIYVKGLVAEVHPETESISPDPYIGTLERRQ